MSLYLLAAIVIALLVPVSVLFNMRHIDRNDIEDFKKEIRGICKSHEKDLFEIGAALHSMRRFAEQETVDGMFNAMKVREQENKAEIERELAEIRDELQQMKIQRDELEREERKVLDGMNNIMNYGFDVARKAARDGGEV